MFVSQASLLSTWRTCASCTQLCCCPGIVCIGRSWLLNYGRWSVIYNNGPLTNYRIHCVMWYIFLNTPSTECDHSRPVIRLCGTTEKQIKQQKILTKPKFNEILLWIKNCWKSKNKNKKSQQIWFGQFVLRTHKPIPKKPNRTTLRAEWPTA